MAAPDAVKKLVDDFGRVAAGMVPDDFDEAQLQQTYVEPLFEALGWNTRDPSQVIVQKRVHVREATKFADYALLVGGRPQVVVEAKDFRKDVNAADFIFQLKRYGYNLPCDFGVLTNFGRWAVYDTGLEPVYENAARGLVKTLGFGYEEYVSRWDDFAAAFSRDAVQAGALKVLLPKARRERNKEALDRKFFERLNEWRAELARVIALRNADCGIGEINEAVQRILDRLIFTRVIEDRGLESVELLLDALNRWKAEKEKPLYQYLVAKFRWLEPHYNGELFYKHFSEDLLIDNATLKDLIESLYYPRCPYQFNVVGVELLGTVYERFLGSTIRLTPTHRAVVEEKPEVRKAGGVYYTPRYIVDYIVANTVGELLTKCKTPGDVAKLKILDPACGSGSFLLGAFDALIKWHEEYYAAHPEKISRGMAAEAVVGAGTDRNVCPTRLTAKFKGRLVVNNLFGVDIDPQACEVTRMSLYLKILEDVDAQFLMKTALLPPLENNVKCGNSLIGPDYFVGQAFLPARGQTRMSVPPDEDEYKRVNPFDWDVEFEGTMKGGGFDAVIGNPPYVSQLGIGEYKDYFVKRYETFVPTADLYVCFIEKALKLTKQGGRFSFIVSNKWMRAAYGAKTREYLTRKYEIERIIDFGLGVFEGATTRPAVVVVKNAGKPTASFEYAIMPEPKPDDLAEQVEILKRIINVKAFKPGEPWGLGDTRNQSVLVKLSDSGIILSEYVKGKINYGIKTGFNEAFVVLSETRALLIKADKKSVEIIKPFVVGEDVRRYSINAKDRYLILTKIGVNIKDYPAVFEHLKQYQKQLEKRGDKGNYWWELRACAYYGEFDKPRIIFADIANEPRFAIADANIYAINTVYMLPTADPYLLGLLNSSVLWFVIKNTAAKLESKTGKPHYRFFKQTVDMLPIRPINFSDAADVARHDKIVALVTRMLDLHKKLAAARADRDRTPLEREVAATDRAIDALVYELYGLTAEEIKIVEGG